MIDVKAIQSIQYFHCLLVRLCVRMIYELSRSLSYQCVRADMAQDMLQMLGVWHDSQYEELQRLRQETVLLCVSYDTVLGVGIDAHTHTRLMTLCPGLPG